MPIRKCNQSWFYYYFLINPYVLTLFRRVLHEKNYIPIFAKRTFLRSRVYYVPIHVQITEAEVFCLTHFNYKMKILAWIFICKYSLIYLFDALELEKVEKYRITEKSALLFGKHLITEISCCISLKSLQVFNTSKWISNKFVRDGCTSLEYFEGAFIKLFRNLLHYSPDSCRRSRGKDGRDDGELNVTLPVTDGHRVKPL